MIQHCSAPKVEVSSSFITTTVWEQHPKYSHTRMEPPVGFELVINCIQFYVIANLEKTYLLSQWKFLTLWLGIMKISNFEISWFVAVSAEKRSWIISLNADLGWRSHHFSLISGLKIPQCICILKCWQTHRVKTHRDIQRYLYNGYMLEYNSVTAVTVLIYEQHQEG